MDKPGAVQIHGGDFFFAIVAARYNSELVDAMLARAQTALKAAGVPERNVEIVRVPGSSEIPYVANMLAYTGEYDCIIALGVVIAGETPHHEILGHGTATALHTIGFNTETPIINGIVVCNTREQAEARTTGAIDRGTEFASAALEMAWHKVHLVERLDELEDMEGEEGEEETEEVEGDDDEGGDDDFDPKQHFKNN